MSDRSSINYNDIVKDLGTPLFIKPANLGSSVGVSKAKNESEFQSAVSLAFNYDNKIIIEEFIKGREIEVSVLGNSNPIASLAGEVIPHNDFYSYEAKYIDAQGATLKIPVELSLDVLNKLQKLAVESFKALCLEGMARVDFFLTDDGRVYVNELNTIPGFTKISQYPRLWEASGIKYSELLDRLIQCAIERFDRENLLVTQQELGTLVDQQNKSDIPSAV